MLEKVLVREDLAFHPKTALGKRRHDLTGLRRRAMTDGIRIIYIASQPLARVIVLLIAERRVARPDDVYELVAARLRAGDFDEAFAELAMQKPPMPPLN